MKKLLTLHPSLTFIVMFVSALAFGLSSYNLFFLIHENVGLVLEHGAMALKDGALTELFMLTLNGIISLSTYIVFKACEKQMVDFTLGVKK
jgi:hypothetical protein